MLFPFLICQETTKTASFEPTSTYKVVLVEGFTVKLSKAAQAAKKELEPAMALLKLRFQEINRTVPAPSLKTLRSVPIWVERNDPKFPCMCYHEDEGWLKENGLNPDKAKGVELANLKTFVSWSFDQPMMVLHEYAHAFHDTRFGFGGIEIKKAYTEAMNQHLYDEVHYYKGQKKKGYASTNQMEYFAELSEALFGYNDFYPFTRGELKTHDPTGYRTVCDAWGVKD